MQKRGVNELLLSSGRIRTSDGGLGLLQGLGAGVDNLLDLSLIEDFSESKITGLADIKNLYACWEDELLAVVMIRT